MSEGRIQLDFGTLNPIQRQVSEEFRRGKRFVAMITGRQGGKALSLDTIIPTPEGYTTMGEVEVGDYVIGADGKPTCVEWKSEVHLGNRVFKITFDTGEVVKADADHLWLAHSKSERKHSKPPKVRTTLEMFESPRAGKENNWSIDLSAPLEGQSGNLPIDPYVLGAWLGDGTVGQPNITQQLPKVRDEIERRGYPLRKISSGKYRYSFSPQGGARNSKGHLVHCDLSRELIALGVYYDKHIPVKYLRAPLSDRWDLYQGLMDTDGYVGKGNKAEITFRDRKLIETFHELVASLGFKPNKIRYRPEVNAYRFGWNVGEGRRVDAKRRFIVSIEEVPSEPTQCIGVDNSDKLFLITKGLIPTHNSHYGARWLISQIATGKGKNKLSIVAAPTFRYARIAQRKLEEVFKSDLRLWRAIKHTKQPIPTYELPDGNIIEVHSVDDPDSVRGLTVDFVWFDEAAVAAGDAFDIMIPTLLASGGSMLLTTTPRGKGNWIYKKIYLKSIPPGEDGHDDTMYSPYYATVFGSTWENVDNLTEEAVRLMEEQYGKGSRFAKQEIEGGFVTYEGLVFQWDEDINFLAPGDMPDLKEFDHIIGGLDFGWQDPNAAVVLGYKDGLWYALDGQYESQQPMDELANQLTVFGERYGVKVWYADSARPDSIAELHSRGIPVVAVKKPTLEDSIRMMSTFANRNRFKVSHRVPWLKDEFQTYQYIEVGRKGQQTPLDKNNHMIDASRYALHMYRWLWANKFDYTTPSEGEDMGDKYTPWGELKRDWKRGEGIRYSSPSGLWGS